jgi:hypothetical protein
VTVALTDSNTITISVIGAVVALALIWLLRGVINKKNEQAWRRIRIGFFVERDPERDQPPDG